MNLIRPFRLWPLNEEDLSKLKYPLILMPKYDGIRCLLHNGKVLSRTLKPIPNEYIQQTLRPYAEHVGKGWLDGELLLNNTKDYNKVQSAVMSVEPDAYDFYYCIFDRVLAGSANEPYAKRLDWVDSMFRAVPFNAKHLRPALAIYVDGPEHIMSLEVGLIQEGYEGLVLRSLDGPYKQGKSTFREGYGFKLKRTEDAEAEILDCIELQHNLNDAETNELGLTKRSSHQANKIGSGMLGSFLVRGLNGRYKGKEFQVSCGSMTHAHKQKHWVRWHLKRWTYEKRVITFTYAKHRGTNEAPAEPRFKCFRKD